MSESYPVQHETLSDTQEDLLNFVETHLEIDPLSEQTVRYSSEATYRNSAGNFPLPGDRIRFAYELDQDDDVRRTTHRIEFISSDYGPLASVVHEAKETDSFQARSSARESRLVYERFDEPCAQAEMAAVEQEVHEVLKHLAGFVMSGSLRPAEK